LDCLPEALSPNNLHPIVAPLFEEEDRWCEASLCQQAFLHEDCRIFPALFEAPVRPSTPARATPNEPKGPNSGTIVGY